MWPRLSRTVQRCGGGGGEREGGRERERKRERGGGKERCKEGMNCTVKVLSLAVKWAAGAVVVWTDE